MPPILPDLAPVVAAAGVLILLLGTALTRRLRPSLGLALEFFLAAGLLGMSGDRGYQAIAVAALVVLVWRLAGGVLRSAT